MAKYYPNKLNGKVTKSSELWGIDKRKLAEQGYIVNFFKSNNYNGQEYYILRKKIGPYFQFEKVSRNGTKNKLPRLLFEGWEIIKEPEEKE